MQRSFDDFVLVGEAELGTRGLRGAIGLLNMMAMKKR